MKKLFACVALTACAGGEAVDNIDTNDTEQAVISDGANGGTAGFFFLPPQAPARVFTGVFDPQYRPRLTIELPMSAATTAPEASATEAASPMVAVERPR